MSGAEFAKIFRLPVMRVLYVEDHADVRELIVLLLEDEGAVGGGMRLG